MHRLGRHILRALLLAPGLLLVVVLLVVPLIDMADVSLHREEFGDLLPGRTLQQYDAILANADYVRLFADTFFYAALVTLFAAVLGYPVAYELVTAAPRWRGILFFMVAAPLLVNAIVRTYGWLLLLGRVGILNTVLQRLGLTTTPIALTGNATGMIIGGVEVFLPFMILSIATSLRAIDVRLYEASTVLGASGWRTFRSVILPLSMPGVIAGSVLVFTLMLGAFVTPLILGGTAVKFLSVAVYVDALVLFNLPRATALAVFLLIATAAAFFAQAALTRRVQR